MRPLTAIALAGCAALLAAAVVVVVPDALPSLWAGVTERPETPALVAAFWIVATTASITGKCALAAGALTWRGATVVHITGTVSNRIVPAGFGAGGAYLIGLRKGGMPLSAASAAVLLWALASGVVHGAGVLVGGLWLHSGLGILVVLVVVALAVWLIFAKRTGRLTIVATARPRRQARDAQGDESVTISCSEDGDPVEPTASPRFRGLRQRVRSAPATIRRVDVPANSTVARARQRLRAVGRSVGEAATIIRAEPRRAITAVAAQTVAMTGLAIGFAVAADSFGAPVPMTTAMAAYVAGTALSATVPTPAGIGSADAALVGALVMVGASMSEAVPAVLVFRSVILLAPILVAALMAVVWATVRRARG